MDSTTSLSEVKLPVMSLPAEVRQIIWECLLTTKAVICMEEEPGWYDLNSFVVKPNNKDSLTSQILRANHSIFSETRPILYGKNVFCLEGDSDLQDFRAVVGEENCSLIQRVAASYRMVNEDPLLQRSLLSWPRLSFLEIIWTFKDGQYYATPMRTAETRVFSKPLILNLSEDSSRSQIVEAVKQYSESELPEIEHPAEMLSPLVARFPAWTTIFPGVTIKITLRWLRMFESFTTWGLIPGDDEVPFVCYRVSMSSR